MSTGMTTYNAALDPPSSFKGTRKLLEWKEHGEMRNYVFAFVSYINGLECLLESANHTYRHAITATTVHEFHHLLCSSEAGPHEARVTCEDRLYGDFCESKIRRYRVSHCAARKEHAMKAGLGSWISSKLLGDTPLDLGPCLNGAHRMLLVVACRQVVVMK